MLGTGVTNCFVAFCGDFTKGATEREKSKAISLNLPNKSEYCQEHPDVLFECYRML